MYVGIDIGGTTVKYGVIDGELNVLFKASFPVRKTSPYDLLDDVCKAVEDLRTQYDFAYIGIGVPGHVDARKGIAVKAGNLPFDCTPVVEYVAQRTSLPVFVGNDANCAALGEYAKTQRQGTCILVTLGTGVGGGIVVDGKLHVGQRGFAGEIGHMVTVKDGLPCPCGRRGCYEQYASATALIRMTCQKIQSGDGEMAQAMRASGETVDGKTAFTYARRGCEDAWEVLCEYADHLATGLENLVNLFDPDMIILTGGIANEKEDLLKYVNRYFSGACEIKISELKNDAGFIGAALLGK